MSDIAVVVLCHEPYLKWLPGAVESIDRQLPPAAERVLVCDGCEPPPLNPHWQVIKGRWGNPAEARNTGAAATAASWLVFWDADNVMVGGYLAAMQSQLERAPADVGIIYPDIHYCDEHLTPQTLRIFPAWDYWFLRAENYVDTAAAWRREALEAAGGWSSRSGLEDYALALDITAAGWQAAKLDGPPVLMRVHDGGRVRTLAREGRLSQEMWRARSCAVVSLLAGRDGTFARWAEFMSRAELPPRTALYVVDNSGREEFTRKIFDECQRLACERSLTHLDFATTGRAYQTGVDENYLLKGRHQHVARLYATVFPRIGEDTVLTLEDDTEPPPDAARRLGEELGHHHHRAEVGAVAAAYAMPHNEHEVCAGDGRDGGWGHPPRWDQLPHAPIDVGCVGGGCTMWANWALRRFPLRVKWEQLLGWDAVLCLELRRRGYRIRLHGGVRCRHHVHGAVRTL
ncbi:MAG: glycosyltransferase [Pyrinomonadaceae bacterium]